MSGVAPIVVASSDATSSVFAYRGVLATQQGGGGGSVTNPIINATLGLNTTGTGTTTIGSTTAGTVAVVSPNVNINTSGSGATVIGNPTTGNSVALVAPAVIVNTTGTGTTTIGSSGAGTVALVSPTVTINTTGTGNTNIGNATGTTTFTGTVVGLGSGTVTSVTAASSNIVIGGTPTVAPTVNLSANPSVTTLTTSSDLTVGQTIIFPRPGANAQIQNISGDMELYAGGATGGRTINLTSQSLVATGSVSWGTYKNLLTSAGNTVARIFGNYLPSGNYNSDLFTTNNITTFTTSSTSSITPTSVDSASYGVAAIRLQSKQSPPTGALQVYVGPGTVSTAITPVLEVNSSGLTLNPGASTLAPFLLGGRNYLDISAPVAAAGNAGALRLIGNNGVVMTVTDNAVLSNVTSVSPPAGTQLRVNIAGTSSALYYDGTSDGPELAGFGGGRLVTSGSGTIVPALSWSGSAVSLAGTVNRTLSSTLVAQPVIQYGTATGSGATGTVVVTFPTAYTSAASYVVQVTMRDSPTAQLYATPTAANKFNIGWTSAGTGTQNIMWTTFGT